MALNKDNYKEELNKLLSNPHVKADPVLNFTCKLMIQYDSWLIGVGHDQVTIDDFNEHVLPKIADPEKLKIVLSLIKHFSKYFHVYSKTDIDDTIDDEEFFKHFKSRILTQYGYGDKDINDILLYDIRIQTYFYDDENDQCSNSEFKHLLLALTDKLMQYDLGTRGEVWESSDMIARLVSKGSFDIVNDVTYYLGNRIPSLVSSDSSEFNLHEFITGLFNDKATYTHRTKDPHRLKTDITKQYINKIAPLLNVSVVYDTDIPVKYDIGNGAINVRINLNNYFDELIKRIDEKFLEDDNLYISSLIATHIKNNHFRFAASIMARRLVDSYVTKWRASLTNSVGVIFGHSLIGMYLDLMGCDSLIPSDVDVCADENSIYLKVGKYTTELMPIHNPPTGDGYETTTASSD